MKAICKSHILTAVLLLIGAQSISACSELYSETWVSPNRLQVEEKKFTQEIPVGDLDASALAGLADHYDRHGEGPLELTVTYDPKSSSNTAMKASHEASRIVQTLRQNGLHNVHPGILPVHGQGDDSRAMISYISYDALAPKDCPLMEGIENSADLRADRSYKLGCSVDTLFARQIARPKDLNGQGIDSTSEGRRSSNIVDFYRSGQPNEPLEGETASE